MATYVGSTLYKIFVPQQHRSERGKQRERWGSRAAFVFACIGSAVGLGNLWRFPSLCYRFGGAAFLLPYGLALFLVGIPILILEFSLGQTFQSGDIISFGNIHRRLAGVGFASVLGAFLVVTYYTVIIAWSIIYFLSSFQSPLPWAASSASGALDAASSYFLSDVLKLPDDPSDGLNLFRGNTFMAAVFAWALIYFSTFRGVAFTGNVVFVSMPLPIFLIVVLAIRGSTLEGASTGIASYLGSFDWTALSEGTIWSEAVSQIFFSVGICFGVMTAYSSYNSKHSNAVQDAFIVSIANSAVSIVAGFAVFSVLGHLAVTSGRELSELDVSGVSLAFITYPVGLSSLPGAQFWSILFFATLFFLGIDSAFALVEAVTTAMKDSRNFRKISHITVTGVVTAIAIVVSIIYSFDGGLYVLDVVDYYINNVLMMFVGLLETVAAGWIYDIDEQVKQVGVQSTVVLALSWVLGTLSAAIISLDVTLESGFNSLIFGLIIGLIIVAAGTFIAWKCADEPAEGTKFHWLFLHNSETLREDLNSVVASGTNWKIPFVWSLLMKYFLPQLMTFMMCINVNSLSQTNGYGGYGAGYQILGSMAALAPLLLCLLAILVPTIMDGWIGGDEVCIIDPETNISMLDDENFKQKSSQIELINGDKFKHAASFLDASA